jgi:hypothetical protein
MSRSLSANATQRTNAGLGRCAIMLGPAVTKVNDESLNTVQMHPKTVIRRSEGSRIAWYFGKLPRLRTHSFEGCTSKLSRFLRFAILRKPLSLVATIAEPSVKNSV